MEFRFVSFIQQWEPFLGPLSTYSRRFALPIKTQNMVF